MHLRFPSSRVSGSTALRVILVVLAIALAINLVFQLRKVWNRITARSATVQTPPAAEPSSTNPPPVVVIASAPVVPPPAMVAVPPEAQPMIVPVAPQGLAAPAQPLVTNRSSSSSSGGSPRGFGSMGFPPGTVPVVLYQPGTLTFVAIPFDEDDLTNGVPGSTNQIPRLTPPD